MMTFFEQYFERGRQQGITQGKAEGLLQLLSARGVPVDDASRQRILSCRDIATLDLGFSRALKASHLSEVLEELTQ